MIPIRLRISLLGIIAWILFSCQTPAAHGQSLRILTLNFWSGLDYTGVFSIGEFETPAEREHRFNVLIAELRRTKPDILALQESNPICSIAARIADSLGYDVLAQRINAGMKIGPIGVPWNLNEGLALLARPELQLELVDVWDLSESFGAVGNTISLHLSDQNYALVGRARAGRTDVYIVNTHLSAATPSTEAAHRELERILDERHAATHTKQEIHTDLDKRAALRPAEVQRLIDHLTARLEREPLIVVGDFNASPESPEMQAFVRAGFLDAAHAGGKGNFFTWDPERNPLSRFSTNPVTAGGDSLDPLDHLSAWHDRQPRRIDYIFLGPGWRPSELTGVSGFPEASADTLLPSDHFGLMAEIDVSSLRQRQLVPDRFTIQSPEPGLDLLPILMYDTDVGFGYGIKTFWLNYLGWSESLDFTLFNSTRGERWYRGVFSVPDFELRQGKFYDLAFDLVVDYDKYLKNNFFGIGAQSKKDQRETYIKAPLDILAVASRGLTPRIVAQLGLRWKLVNNTGYASDRLFASLPALNHGRSQSLSLYTAFRYDSRDSYINPSRGNVVQVELEAAPRAAMDALFGSGDTHQYSFSSAFIGLHAYHTLFYPKTVLAARLQVRFVGGTNLPVHSLVSLGGSNTLRGFPQDRFLERFGALANLEVRFPITWRFGGVLFLDAGRPAGRFSALTPLSRGWKSNFGAGLRFYMDTFVVRADLGFSNESMGFYFNFGHVF